MRQLLKISLLLIYVFFNAGLSYSLHYCGEELKDINWLAESTPCCPAEEGEEDCCEDVFYSEYHSSDQQSKQFLNFQFGKLQAQAIPASFATVHPTYSNDHVKGLPYFYQQYPAPPFPLYIKNQVFLI